MDDKDKTTHKWQEPWWMEWTTHSPVSQGWPSSDSPLLWPPSSDSRLWLWFCFWQHQSSQICIEKKLKGAHKYQWGHISNTYVWGTCVLPCKFAQLFTQTSHLEITKWGVCSVFAWQLAFIENSSRPDMICNMTKKPALLSQAPNRPHLWTVSFFFWKRKTSKRNGQNTRETFKYVPVIYFNYANKPIWWVCAAARSRINRMSPLTKPTRVSVPQTWTVQTIWETSCPFLRVCCQGVGNQRAELYEKNKQGKSQQKQLIHWTTFTRPRC